MEDRTGGVGAGLSDEVLPFTGELVGPFFSKNPRDRAPSDGRGEAALVSTCFKGEALNCLCFLGIPWEKFTKLGPQ